MLARVRQWAADRRDLALLDCAEGKHRMSWWLWHTMGMPGGHGVAACGWFSICVVCRIRFELDGRTARPPGLWTLGLPIRPRRAPQDEQAHEQLHQPGGVQAGEGDLGGSDADSGRSA